MAIIDKPSDYFNTVLYSGTGSEQTVSGVDFQPDWTWLKSRSNTQPHVVSDSVRGATKQLYTSDTQAETSYSQYVKSFNSDGFVLGTDSQINQSSQTFVSWNWKAGTTSGISGSANITPNAYSFNQDSGFSVVTYNGTDVAGNTVLHGLGAVPHVIFVKRRVSSGYDWVVYHKNKTAGLYLNATGNNNDSSSNNIWFNGAAPTSTVFSIGTDGRIGDDVSTGAYVVYSFAPKIGFSKFGAYTGNGNADGPMVYTGFKVGWLMVKLSSGTDDWQILDNKRSPINIAGGNLNPNTNGATIDNDVVDFLSNGFKLRASSGSWNANGSTFIYMAFAENPFVTSTSNGSIPATAR